MKIVFIFLYFISINLPAQVISPGLTAVYEHQRQVVKIKWNHNDKRIISYALQKSADNTTWIHMQQIIISNPQQYKFINFLDEMPGDGRMYYRLKCTLQDGSVIVLAPIMVIMGKPGNNWLLYPVPVKDVLHIQYNGNALIEGVISIVIQNAGGRVFHQLRFASSTRLIRIPVSNLGSGIYDVRIIVANKVKWNQRFVK